MPRIEIRIQHVARAIRARVARHRGFGGVSAEAVDEVYGGGGLGGTEVEAEGVGGVGPGGWVGDHVGGVLVAGGGG